MLELEQRSQDLQIQEKGSCRITNEPVCVSTAGASRLMNEVILQESMRSLMKKSVLEGQSAQAEEGKKLDFRLSFLPY